MRAGRAAVGIRPVWPSPLPRQAGGAAMQADGAAKATGTGSRG